jgi:hypothetical protein
MNVVFFLFFLFLLLDWTGLNPEEEKKKQLKCDAEVKRLTIFV